MVLVIVSKQELECAIGSRVSHTRTYNKGKIFNMGCSNQSGKDFKRRVMIHEQNISGKI